MDKSDFKETDAVEFVYKQLKECVKDNDIMLHMYHILIFRGIEDPDITAEQCKAILLKAIIERFGIGESSDLLLAIFHLLDGYTDEWLDQTRIRKQYLCEYITTKDGKPKYDSLDDISKSVADNNRKHEDPLIKKLAEKIASIKDIHYFTTAIGDYLDMGTYRGRKREIVSPQPSSRDYRSVVSLSLSSKINATVADITNRVMNYIIADDELSAMDSDQFDKSQYEAILKRKAKNGELTKRFCSGCAYYLKVTERTEGILSRDPDPVIDTDKQDMDWLLRFFDAVSTVSNEDMQELWARVLAGEIKQHGSFSLRTIETLHNMRKEEAELFQKASSLILTRIDNTRFIFDDEDLTPMSQNENPYGMASHLNSLNAGFGLDKREISILEECGLISISRKSYTMQLDDRMKYNGFLMDDSFLLIKKNCADDEYHLEYKCYTLTSVAYELLTIMEAPKNHKYLETLLEYYQKSPDYRDLEFSECKVADLENVNPYLYEEAKNIVDGSFEKYWVGEMIQELPPAPHE